MTRAIKQSVAMFFAFWIAAHAIYAFVMMDWSPFTEWEPLTRAALLFASLGFASLPISLAMLKDMP